MVLLREVHKYWVMHTRRTCEFGLDLASLMLSLSTLSKSKMGCSFLLLLLDRVILTWRSESFFE